MAEIIFPTKWATNIETFTFDDPGNLAEINRFVLAQEIIYKKTTELASLKGPTGFHSTDDIVAGDESWQILLKETILQQCRKYLRNVTEEDLTVREEKLSCWAMVMREGDYSTVHSHPGADVSGVFYSKVPDLDGYQGTINFLDPRPSARSHRYFSKTNTITVKPQQGVGLIFPPWLDHYVMPHRVKGTRISLAFNYALD